MVSTFPHDHGLLLFSLAVIYLDPDNVCDKTNSVFCTSCVTEATQKSWVLVAFHCVGILVYDRLSL